MSGSASAVFANLPAPTTSAGNLPEMPSSSALSSPAAGAQAAAKAKASSFLGNKPDMPSSAALSSSAAGGVENGKQAQAAAKAKASSFFGSLPEMPSSSTLPNPSAASGVGKAQAQAAAKAQASSFFGNMPQMPTSMAGAGTMLSSARSKMPQLGSVQSADPYVEDENQIHNLDFPDEVRRAYVRGSRDYALKAFARALRAKRRLI